MLEMTENDFLASNVKKHSVQGADLSSSAKKKIARKSHFQSAIYSQSNMSQVSENDFLARDIKKHPVCSFLSINMIANIGKK